MTTSASVMVDPAALDAAALPVVRTPAPATRWTLHTLVLGAASAFLTQAVAAALSRRGEPTWGLVLTFVAVALAFGPPLAVLVARHVSRGIRTAATLALGLVPTVQWRATDPLLFTGFDEQLHVRTLVDITASHQLGHSNPLLEVGPHYPGLESLAAVFEQLGLPMMAAATITILLARVVLVLVLSRAVEDLTGSARAGALAVAAYATSQQFFAFDSQFAYQTLAAPLALAAVACVARARRSTDPRPALWCSALCIVAVVVTHHVTGALLTAFLLAWAVSSRRRPGAGPVWLATVMAAVATAIWSATQWSSLVGYFGPVVDTFFTELHGAGQRRHAFSDGGGSTTPVWERLMILYYAGLTSLVTVCVAFPRLRDTAVGRLLFRRRSPHSGARPNLLIVLPALAVPVTFAARSLPQVGELSDRGTTFLFLPLAALVGFTFVRLRDRGFQLGRVARCTAVLLATGLYVGGVVLGNGPDWQRLPGEWLASAENRSMDTETLAAVEWAGDNLPAGSRIAADRISGDLLSARARLWVVSTEGHADPAALYFAKTWDTAQLQVIRQLHLQYLYVDERLSTQLPHVGVYFHPGETPAPQQLTRAALTKWDGALGISVAYRHGPVTIYDLTGLDVGPRTTGWTGDRPSPGLPEQVCMGLAAGLATLWMSRSRRCAGARRALRLLGQAAGPALGLAVAVSALCVVSVLLLFVGVWTGPAAVATLTAVLLVRNRRGIGAAVRRSAARARPRVSPATAAVLVAAIAVAVAATVLAVGSAHLTDVTAVDHILGLGSAHGSSGR